MGYRIEASCVIGVPDSDPPPLADHPTMWERLEAEAVATTRDD